MKSAGQRPKHSAGARSNPLYLLVIFQNSFWFNIFLHWNLLSQFQPSSYDNIKTDLHKAQRRGGVPSFGIYVESKIFNWIVHLNKPIFPLNFPKMSLKKGYFNFYQKELWQNGIKDVLRVFKVTLVFQNINIGDLYK